jgi:hypothetical protein
MMDNSVKEFHVFCDFETNTALLRIFQYTNYKWCGGKVFEFQRDEIGLKRIGRIIEKYGVKNNNLLLQSDIFLNGKTEKAVVYKVDFKKKKEEIS